jgi:hypothetical protein
MRGFRFGNTRHSNVVNMRRWSTAAPRGWGCRLRQGFWAGAETAHQRAPGRGRPGKRCRDTGTCAFGTAPAIPGEWR